GHYNRGDTGGARRHRDTEANGSGTFDHRTVAGLETRLFDGMKTGTERLEQRGLLDVHRGRNQVRIFNRRDGEFGECAGERGRRDAEMETIGAARTASPAMAEGIQRDSIADLEIGDARADLNDFAGGFVAENERQPRDHPFGTELPIDDVQVGAAYAARADANEQRGIGGTRHGSVDHFSAGCGTGLGDCFQSGRPLASFNTTSQRLASKRNQSQHAKAIPNDAAKRAIAHTPTNEAVVGVLFQRVSPAARLWPRCLNAMVLV